MGQPRRKRKKSTETLAHRVGKVELTLERIESQLRQNESCLEGWSQQAAQLEQSISNQLIDLQNRIREIKVTGLNPDGLIQLEEGTAVNLEELAHKLGFPKLDDLFLAAGKDEFSLRHVEHVLHGDDGHKKAHVDAVVVPKKSRASSVVHGAKSGVLVVGTDGLMTQLAKCCKPAPPDAIVGFITRGKGVSIHRANCKNFAEMEAKAPERVIHTAWGKPGNETVYPVDIFILANDRQGLLRDISEIFLREKINVIGVSTQSAKGQARMAFTAEIGSTAQLLKALTVIREVDGVMEARRQ